MDTIAEWPLGAAVVTLFVIVFLRANATYWLGRGAVRGGRASTHLRRHLEGRAMARAESFSARFGPFAVPLVFLTIGLQTAVLFSAGFTSMPLRRFLPAVTVGCVMWAVFYATIGMVGWQTVTTAVTDLL